MKFRLFVPVVALLLHVIIFTSCKDDDAIDNSLSPIVTSSFPLQNADGIARNAYITATFSMEMNPSTLNNKIFTLKQGGTNIPGIVEYDGLTATFTPLGGLGASTNYTATITTEAKSTHGKALESNHVWNFSTGGSQTSLNAVNIRSAGNYVILAKTAINNSSTSTIIGNIGISPAAASYIVGLSLVNAGSYATSDQVTGYVHAADMADPTPMLLTIAVQDMLTAYNDAAGRSSNDFLELATGNIGGLTLSPGLYKWNNTVTVSSDITLTGNSTDVWIFQIGQNLTLSTTTRVILSGGARADNIFWQVAGQATFGTTSHFEGIILSMTGITLQTGASINGRALAQTAVVLDANTVNQ